MFGKPVFMKRVTRAFVRYIKFIRGNKVSFGPFCKGRGKTGQGERATTRIVIGASFFMQSPSIPILQFWQLDKVRIQNSCLSPQTCAHLLRSNFHLCLMGLTRRKLCTGLEPKGAILWCNWPAQDQWWLCSSNQELCAVHIPGFGPYMLQMVKVTINTGWVSASSRTSADADFALNKQLKD